MPTRDSIDGYKAGRRLTAEEKIFKKQILEKEIGLNETTSKEIFRQGIPGFEEISQFSEDGINHLVAQMKKNTSPFCSNPEEFFIKALFQTCLLYTSPSPRDRTRSRMPSSA